MPTAKLMSQFCIMQDEVVFNYLLLTPQLANAFSPNGTPTTLKQA